MRTITILLTKYSDWTSTLVYYLCGRGYTHASISLDSGNTYYSFNRKGFCVETLDKHRRRGVKRSLGFQFMVSETAYRAMCWKVAAFEANRQKFHYTWLGVLFCILGIPLRRKYYYFCSQFVAETLRDAGALFLRKSPALYLPNDFRRELEGNAQLSRVEWNPV